MNTQPLPHRRRPAAVKQRLRSHLIHIPRYSNRGVRRLAHDSGVAESTLSYLLRELGHPEYSVIHRLHVALSNAAERCIAMDEIAVPSHLPFPTACPCALYACSCLPPWAYSPKGALTEPWKDVAPGTWTEATGSDTYIPLINR
jgi:hypothetical protein